MIFKKFQMLQGHLVLPVLVEDGFSAILFLAEFPKTAQLIVVKQKKFWE